MSAEQHLATLPSATLATTTLLSASMRVTLPGSAYTRSHAVFGLPNLAYFTEHHALQVHPQWCPRQGFLSFSRWETIPLYRHAHFRRPFTHGATLRLFPTLTPMNNAKLNRECRYLFEILFDVFVIRTSPLWVPSLTPYPLMPGSSFQIKR